MLQTIFIDVDFADANLETLDWRRTICPNGTNSQFNDDTCQGHLLPRCQPRSRRA